MGRRSRWALFAAKPLLLVLASFAALAQACYRTPATVPEPAAGGEAAQASLAREREDAPAPPAPPRPDEGVRQEDEGRYRVPDELWDPLRNVASAAAARSEPFDCSSLESPEIAALRDDPRAVENLEALVVPESPLVTGSGDSMSQAATWEVLLLRRAALHLLVALATPDALAAVDRIRDQRAAERRPWVPLPIFFAQRGEACAEATTECSMYVADETEESIQRCMMSADGAVTVRFDGGLGQFWDLWVLVHREQGPVWGFIGQPQDTGPAALLAVTSSADALSISYEPASVHCLTRDQRERLAGDPDYANPSETETWSWDDILGDRDGDGWTDRVEERLGTDPDKADSDGDTLVDPVDPAPLGSRQPEAGCTREAALATSLSTFVLLGPPEPPLRLVAGSEANLHYQGLGSQVIWSAPDDGESDTRSEENQWWPLVRFVARPQPDDLGYDFVENALDAVAISDDGQQAVVGIFYVATPVLAGTTWVSLVCHNGRWYPCMIGVLGLR